MADDPKTQKLEQERDKAQEAINARNEASKKQQEADQAKEEADKKTQEAGD